VQERAAIGAEVFEVEGFALFEVAIGEFVDSFNGGHVDDSGVFKVDNDFLRVVHRIKLFVECSDGGKK